jgi:hypothetical protein
MYVRVRRKAYDERMGRCKAFLAGTVLTFGEEKTGVPVSTRPRVKYARGKVSLAN